MSTALQWSDRDHWRRRDCGTAEVRSDLENISWAGLGEVINQSQHISMKIQYLCRIFCNSLLIG